MHDIRLVARIRLKQWRAGALYWLAVLGVETNLMTLMTRIYVLYFFLIFAGWLLISWSGLLYIAHLAGTGLPSTLRNVLPNVLYVVAMAWWTAALAQLPLLMPHGDLEWMVGSPISRRAILFFGLVLSQVKAVLIALILATVAFSLLGGQHLYTGSLMAAAVVGVIQAGGWSMASARASRQGVPKRFLWLLPGLMIPLRVVLPQVVAPFAYVLVSSSMVSAFTGVLSVWMAVGAMAMWLSSGVNMISVASQSMLYADTRAALPPFGVGSRGQVRQNLLMRHGMRGKRPRGHLRLGSVRWWEISRFTVSTIRMPRQLLYMLETAALFRSSLLAVFLTHSLTAWMFWVFAAYRFRFNGMALWYRNDTETPFVRQFWPDSDIGRYLKATAVPLAVIAALSFAMWVFLPLAIPVTWLHGLFWLGLIVTWWAAEGPLLMNAGDTERLLSGHDTAVVATGLMLAIGAAFDRPGLALCVPVAGLLIAFRRSRRDVGLSISQQSATGGSVAERR